MITLEQYLSSNGKYPERVKSPELTKEKLQNAKNLLERVNSLLADLGVSNVVVSSGFRTSAANAGIANAAKKSAHMSCLAVDVIDDKNQSLAAKCTPELLKKHELFMEDEKHTKGQVSNWVHWDMVKRADRPSRKFIP